MPPRAFTQRVAVLCASLQARWARFCPGHILCAAISHWQHTAPRVQEWVTGGVVVFKSETRTSSKGKKYVSFRLSQLQRDDVSVVAFGSAYEKLWNVSLGLVVVLVRSCAVWATASRRAGGVGRACPGR